MIDSVTVLEQDDRGDQEVALLNSTCCDRWNSVEMKTNVETFCSLLADFTFEGKGSIIVAHLHYHKNKSQVTLLCKNKTHLIRKTFQVYRINLFSTKGDWKYSCCYSNTRVCDYNPNNNVNIRAKKKKSTQRIQKKALKNLIPHTHRSNVHSALERIACFSRLVSTVTWKSSVQLSQIGLAVVQSPDPDSCRRNQTVLQEPPSMASNVTHPSFSSNVRVYNHETLFLKHSNLNKNSFLAILDQQHGQLNELLTAAVRFLQPGLNYCEAAATVTSWLYRLYTQGCVQADGLNKPTGGRRRFQKCNATLTPVATQLRRPLGGRVWIT